MFSRHVYIIRARLLQSLFFLFFLQDSLQFDKIFVQFVQRIPGNRIEVIGKGPPFGLLLFNRNIQNRTRLKGPFSNFFSALKLFRKKMTPKGPPSILLKCPLVISGEKRYIRTFDVISELYCVLLRRRRRFENRRISRKTSCAHFKNCAF